MIANPCDWSASPKRKRASRAPIVSTKNMARRVDERAGCAEGVVSDDELGLPTGEEVETVREKQASTEAVRWWYID